ncbi:MAG TPA: NAD-dependent epimerase/dehydratase family protein [Candidatus Paceibacterota bacterium]
MAKAVVTGGAGFIGTHIVQALKDKGFEVVIVDIKTGGDIRKPADLAAAFAGADYIFHTAALPRVQYSIEQPLETHDTNITGTLNVLVAARDAGVKKVVYSASSSAYGDQSTMPLVESMSPNPLSPYGLQKHVGELYCKIFSEVYGLPAVSLRYFNVYGPGFDPEGAYALVIGKFLKQRSEGAPMTITGDGTQTRDFTHVRDVVRANLLAAESDKVGCGEVINIGAGNNFSVNRIAELIGGPVEHIEPRLEPRDSLADNRKAKELLGWQPTIRLEDGIAELKKLFGLLD